MEEILAIVKSMGGTALAVVVIVASYLIAQRLLAHKLDSTSTFVFVRRLVLFSIGFIGLFVLIMVLPIGHELRGQIIGFLGVIISAGLVLSSTTLLGNALSGVMIRWVNNFKPGDFITIKDVFGRVTKRGAFSTEIQTPDRDLITLPNLHLATNPVKVLRDSGTIIKASVSLGYDVQRVKIEESLLKAARNVGLKEPFVFITALGDFSVNYVVHGLLEDCSRLLTTKSNLHEQMLDQLHEDGIEIVSPTFMNQRQVTEQVYIPERNYTKSEVNENVEELLFDKAKLAKELEESQMKISEVDEKISEVEQRIKKEGGSENLVRRLDSYKMYKKKLLEKMTEEKGKFDKE